jgi:hypothetical protein
MASELPPRAETRKRSNEALAASCDDEAAKPKRQAGELDQQNMQVATLVQRTASEQPVRQVQGVVPVQAAGVTGNENDITANPAGASTPVDDKSDCETIPLNDAILDLSNAVQPNVLSAGVAGNANDNEATPAGASTPVDAVSDCETIELDESEWEAIISRCAQYPKNK